MPLTSSTRTLYPCEAYVTVGGKTLKAMADQIATVSKQRLGKRVEALSPEDMASIERIVRIQLGLL